MSHASGLISRSLARSLALLAASILRSQHRICGVLAGTLPQAAQQNVFLGMPLLLLPEEVVLLLEQGMIKRLETPETRRYAESHLLPLDRISILCRRPHFARDPNPAAALHMGTE